MSGAGVLGSVESFNGCKDDWPQYVERLEHFFVANGVDTAEKKRATFLTLIGGATYKTLRNLISPDKPGDKSYSGSAEQALQARALRDSGAVQVPQSQSKAGRVGRDIHCRTTIAGGILQL